MKIGIVTYHRAHNYGAVLQGYALQKFLKDLGHDAEFLDYWPAYHSKEYGLAPHFFSQTLRGKIKTIVYLFLGFSKMVHRRQGFNGFIRTQFKLSALAQFSKPEISSKNVYDVIIYGSDQIWRKHNYPNFKGFDEFYFGRFSPESRKKITYGASMGVIQLEDGDIEFLRGAMTRFDSISVREADLKQIIEKNTSREATLVLDPVFLLDRAAWASITAKPMVKKKYILSYPLIKSRDLDVLTQRIRERSGYEVIELLGYVNPLNVSKNTLQAADPFQFLSLIMNADFVVTSSFHGVAFSIIFEKQFYALGMGANSGRAETLLNCLGIKNRYLSNIDEVSFGEALDYAKINERLSKQKEHSIRFLCDSILNH